MPCTAMTWIQRWTNRVKATLAPVPVLTAPLWLATMERYDFLRRLNLQERAKLRALSALFLQNKEFYGAHDLVITDAMAAAIAAQACLPLLHWGDAAQALQHYDDFVGIVVYPAEAVAHRQVQDGNGILHEHTDILLGQAMQGGPIVLSWQAVEQAGQGAHAHSSVVIHEFMHKIDMRNGHADGYPPLPAGYLGHRHAATARAHWTQTWSAAYDHFQQALRQARQGRQAWPWLNAYAATAPAEFFAVVCEAYFVSPEQCAQELPTLYPLLQAYFQPDAPLLCLPAPITA